MLFSSKVKLHLVEGDAQDELVPSLRQMLVLSRAFSLPLNVS